MDLHIEGMPNFAVKKGYSAETSGGILCMLDKDKVSDFRKESLNDYGQETWEVGQVVKGSRKAEIREDCEVIQVTESFLKNVM